MPVHPAMTLQSPFTGPIYALGDRISSDDILSPLYLSFDLTQPDERKILADYAFQTIENTFGIFKKPGAPSSPYKIILAGQQFGHGSARPHPVIALAEAGIKAIIAKSFADGFHRACANEGTILPIILAKTSDNDPTPNFPQSGDLITINLRKGNITWSENNQHPIEPLGIILDIYNQGGLRHFSSQATPQ